MKQFNLFRSAPGAHFLQSLACCFFLLLIFSGCSAKEGIFSLDDSPFSIERVKTTASSTDGNIEAEQTEYKLNSLDAVESIQDADFDETSKILFVCAGVKENKTYISYDRDKEILLWHGWGNMNFTLLKNENLLLSDKKGSKVYDARTGNFYTRSPGYLTMYEDAAIMASPDTFASIDVRTGKKIWVRKGQSWQGYRNLYRDGDMVYIVAEGLHALNIGTGNKWEYLTPTSYINHGKEIAKQLAISCIAAALGGYSTSQYKPEVTHNMCSDPYFTDDKILFAARDKMVCLEKKSGRLLWEAAIDPELEGMDLYYVSDKDVALVGSGLKLVDYRLQKSANPTVRLFDIESGKMTAYFALDKDKHTYVQHFYSEGGKYYLLTPQLLYILNRNLQQEAVIETNREYGDFIKVLSADSAIILRCSKGVAALRHDTFKEKWYWYSEPPQKSVAETWMQPYSEKVQINSKSVLRDGYYFTPCENSRYKVLDLLTGKEVLRFDMYNDDYRHLSGLQFINFKDTKVKLVEFKNTGETREK